MRPTRQKKSFLFLILQKYNCKTSENIKQPLQVTHVSKNISLSLKTTESNKLLKFKEVVIEINLPLRPLNFGII